MQLTVVCTPSMLNKVFEHGDINSINLLQDTQIINGMHAVCDA